MFHSNNMLKSQPLIFVPFFCVLLFGGLANVIPQDNSNATKSVQTSYDSGVKSEELIYDPVLQTGLTDTLNNRDCKCKNGQCLEKNGKLVCQCPPEYGAYTPTMCKECNCGKDSNCTFEAYGWMGLQTKKICICRERYTEFNGTCVEVTRPSTQPTIPTTQGLTRHITEVTTDTAFNSSLDFNFTTYEPSNFTADSNRTTQELLDFTTVSNATTYLPSIFTYDTSAIRSSTELPWNNTVEFNTSFEPTNSTRGTVFTTDESPVDIYNHTTYKPSEVTDSEITRSSDTDLKTVSLTSVSPSVPDCDCGPKSTGCQFNDQGTKICICFPGYSQMGGICSDCYCGEKSTSCHFDMRGSKVCSCFEGYAQRNRSCSETCSKDNDCLNGGLCTRNEGGANFCLCKSNFSGDKCEVSRICEKLKPVCSAMGAVCRLVGLRGVCECPPHKAFSSNSGLCEDICDSRKCLHGNCEIVGKDFKCQCDEGFTGKHCDERTNAEKDVCDTRRCLHGKCEKVDDIYKCSCDEGFSGTHCEDKIKDPLGYQITWITFIIFTVLTSLLFIGTCCVLFQIRKSEKKVLEKIFNFE